MANEFEVLERLSALQRQLMETVPHGVSEQVARNMIAGLGVIEETLEYLNSLGHKPWRPNPLSWEKRIEELVDILFFYLELVEMSGFSWGEIIIQYEAKHAENLDRYERSKRGDWSWDERSTKREL